MRNARKGATKKLDLGTPDCFGCGLSAWKSGKASDFSIVFTVVRCVSQVVDARIGSVRVVN
jgi:hypothetical protein